MFGGMLQRVSRAVLEWSDLSGYSAYTCATLMGGFSETSTSPRREKFQRTTITYSRVLGRFADDLLTSIFYTPFEHPKKFRM